TTLFRSSSTHKYYSDWNPEFFKKKAARLGAHVLGCVERILVSHDYPEIGYKRAMGVIQLHKSYGPERLDNACKRALEGEASSYQHIKNILKNNMDRASLFYRSPQKPIYRSTPTYGVPPHTNNIHQTN